MAAYFNCGARDAVTEAPIKTKTQLRKMIEENPASVFFYGTAPDFPPEKSGYRGDELSTTTPIMVVVGPDPYAKRSWYANVLIKNGKAHVA